MRNSSHLFPNGTLILCLAWAALVTVAYIFVTKQRLEVVYEGYFGNGERFYQRGVEESTMAIAKVFEIEVP